MGRREMTKTKEQLEEEKKISLSIRIKPLELDGMDGDALKEKASELWEVIVRLETEKYDLEERPGKKPGDPESPDDEDEGPAEAPPGAEEEEEEEEKWPNRQTRKTANPPQKLLAFPATSQNN